MALAFACTGLALVGSSSEGLMWLHHQSGIPLFKSVAYHNFLFIRLGNVFFLFALFLAFRHFLKGKLMVEIGQRTLGIYVLHFVVLYGSWFGLGLTKFFYRSLAPAWVIPGAFLFVGAMTALVLYYYRKRPFDGIGFWLQERAGHAWRSNYSRVKNKIGSYLQTQ